MGEDVAKQVIKTIDVHIDEEKELKNSLVQVAEGLNDIIGETEGLDNHLENVVDRMTDIINEHDQKPGVASHGSVQIGLDEIIEQMENAIDIHKKELKKNLKKDLVPKKLENAVEKIQDIIEKHDKKPGVDGHKEVQKSLIQVTEGLEDIIGETKGLDNHLENVVDRMTDIINEHDQKPGVASHGSVQIGLGEVIKQVENAIDIHEKENEEKEKEKERKKKKDPEVPELLESVVDQVEVI